MELEGLLASMYRSALSAAPFSPMILLFVTVPSATGVKKIGARRTMLEGTDVRFDVPQYVASFKLGQLDFAETGHEKQEHTAKHVM